MAGTTSPVKWDNSVRCVHSAASSPFAMSGQIRAGRVTEIFAAPAMNAVCSLSGCQGVRQRPVAVPQSSLRRLACFPATGERIPSRLRSTSAQPKKGARRRLPLGAASLKKRTAACSCGQLTVTVSGDPAYVATCNCLECQKSTGSVFGTSSYWSKSQICDIQGDRRLYRRGSFEGRLVDNYFCAHCGSTVFWFGEFDPDQIGISVGNFADPSFPPPQDSIWCESKHSWVQFPHGCRLYSQQP